MGSISAGSILGRSFAIWMRNFVPFTMLSLVVYSPMIIWALVILLSADTGFESIKIFGYVMIPAMMLLQLIATGAMTFGVFEQMRGTPASIGRCLIVGLSRLLPIIGVGLLSGLAILGGFILVIVPGIMIMCALWVAVPVAVVERPGVGASLARSSALTKGHRWSIFGVAFLLIIINYLVSLITLKVLLDHPKSYLQIKLYLIIYVLEMAVLGALQSVAAAVGYHDLRVAKDGVAVDQLAAVFE